MAALADIHKMSGKPRPYWVPVVNNIHSAHGIEDIISTSLAVEIWK